MPDGWTLCNGVTSNGITPPNLSGRFVVGIGSNGTTSYSQSITGGQDAVTLTANQMPQHSHTYSGTTNITGNHTHLYANNYRAQSNKGGSGGGSSTKTNSVLDGTWDYTRGNGNHSHSFNGTTSLNGSSTAHENRPAYYAIAYIMRVK